jgi:hypothetical protein
MMPALAQAFANQRVLATENRPDSRGRMPAPPSTADIRQLVGRTLRITQGPCKGDEVVVMMADFEHPGELQVMWRRQPTEWLPGMVAAAGEWSSSAPPVEIPAVYWIPAGWLLTDTVYSEEVIQLQLRELERRAYPLRHAAGLPWDHPDSNPVADMRAFAAAAHLHAPCLARIHGLEVDLVAARNINANQLRTIEDLQRQIREGVGRQGWGQRG